jgi:hypothetical protein
MANGVRSICCISAGYVGGPSMTAEPVRDGVVVEAIGEADMVSISVNTPTNTKGLGAGQASDLKWV